MKRGRSDSASSFNKSDLEFVLSDDVGWSDSEEDLSDSGSEAPADEWEEAEEKPAPTPGPGRVYQAEETDIDEDNTMSTDSPTTAPDAVDTPESKTPSGEIGKRHTSGSIPLLLNPTVQKQRAQALAKAEAAHKQLVADAKQQRTSELAIAKLNEAYQQLKPVLDKYENGACATDFACQAIDQYNDDIRKAFDRGLWTTITGGTSEEAHFVIGTSRAQHHTPQSLLAEAKQLIEQSAVIHQHFYRDHQGRIQGAVSTAAKQRIGFGWRSWLPGTQAWRQRQSANELYKDDRKKRDSWNSYIPFTAAYKAHSNKQPIASLRKKVEQLIADPNNPDAPAALHAALTDMHSYIEARASTNNDAVLREIESLQRQLANAEIQALMTDRPEHGKLSDRLADATMSDDATLAQSRAAVMTKQLASQPGGIPRSLQKGKVDDPYKINHNSKKERETAIKYAVAQKVQHKKPNESLHVKGGSLKDRIIFMQAAIAMGETNITFDKGFPKDYGRASAAEQLQYDQLMDVCVALSLLPADVVNAPLANNQDNESSHFERLLALAAPEEGGESHLLTKLRSKWGYNDKESEANELLERYLKGKFPAKAKEQAAKLVLDAFSPGNGLMQRAAALSPHLRATFMQAVDAGSKAGEEPAINHERERGPFLGRRQRRHSTGNLAGKNRKGQTPNLRINTDATPPTSRVSSPTATPSSRHQKANSWGSTRRKLAFLPRQPRRADGNGNTSTPTSPSEPPASSP